MTPELDRLLAHLRELTDHLNACTHEYTAAVQAALPPEVKTHLDALESAHAAQVSMLTAEIEHVKGLVQIAAVDYGRSVKAHGWNVVYSMGRIKWDDVWLQGYAATHEEILQARIEGQPYITLRKG